jgi:HPt (histidine-containing phosphotransfer) domain-containing protein
MTKQGGESIDSSPAGGTPHTSNQTQAWRALTLQYLRDLPRQLDGIVRLLDMKDYGGIRDDAHRMKGTSGTYRLNSIAQQLAQLERLADNEEESQIVALVGTIVADIQRQTTALASLVAGEGDAKEGGTDG